MIGNHGYEVILDGYIKGIVSNDLAAIAYEAMKEEVIIFFIIHCHIYKFIILLPVSDIL